MNIFHHFLIVFLVSLFFLFYFSMILNFIKFFNRNISIRCFFLFFNKLTFGNSIFWRSIFNKFIRYWILFRISNIIPWYS
mmetsp:Transcript_12320/g.1108  ORF Transcript_12320/g.1108 Transcript_12320/m.1108 type:complete len:80 (-) Transcript_12320:107-346(-)